jgi:hypothetical protein
MPLKRKMIAMRIYLGHNVAVCALPARPVFLASLAQPMVSDMDNIFLICAAVGGTLLLCQVLLSALGLGEHHEVGGHDIHVEGDHEVGHEGAISWFISALTFRSIVAAVTFFGLGGLAASSGGWEPVTASVVALAVGSGALFLVAALMQGLKRLKSDGTVRMDRAVGESGTVYLPIPGSKAGIGKVQLKLQNRTVECQAITAQADLAAGAKIVVVSLVSPDTVEVVSVTELER